MTVKTDVRLVQQHGPTIVRTLATNIARDTWVKVKGRRLPAGVQTTDVDPFDPETSANPYPAYRALLAGAAVHYNPRRDIFLLARYADVKAAARADRALSSADGVTYGRTKLPLMLTSDDPVHARMRKQALPGFTRGALASWQAMADHLARTLVAEMVQRTTADVVSTLAVPMPMDMIAHILGIPDGDRAAFRHWSNETVRLAEVNTSITGLREVIPTLRGLRQFHSYFTAKLAAGDLLGPDTLLGRLARHHEEGQLSDGELFFLSVLLLLAGNETTTNLLSTLFLTLAEHPDLLPMLRDQPDLIGPAIEEQLRFSSPVQSLYRTARVDYPVGSAVIPAGSRVLLLWGAANRDPRQFDNPDELRIDRNPNAHLAFGSGVHLCLGAPLARMEAQAVLREVVAQVDRVEIAGSPAWTTNPSLRGLTRLGVRLQRRGPDHDD